MIRLLLYLDVPSVLAWFFIVVRFAFLESQNHLVISLQSNNLPSNLLINFYFIDTNTIKLNFRFFT